MTLDESEAEDHKLEIKGTQFIVDPYAASAIDLLEIKYDEFEDDFVVRVPNGPQSSC